MKLMMYEVGVNRCKGETISTMSVCAIQHMYYICKKFIEKTPIRFDVILLLSYLNIRTLNCFDVMSLDKILNLKMLHLTQVKIRIW